MELNLILLACSRRPVWKYKICSECHTNGHIPHEKNAAVVWTREKRRARANTTSAQLDSKRRMIKRRTTAKMYGYHQEGHESEWNGGEGCSGSE